MSGEQHYGITDFKNIAELELDNTVWRYLTFPKFISLITYQALWFSKLNILQDTFEGCLPLHTEKKLNANNQKYKEQFHADFHSQIDNWVSDNVKYGRELEVVSCWFLGEEESRALWEDYVGDGEGVAIKSTIRQLSQFVFAYSEFSSIGKVKYVDFNSYDMDSYEAHQARERAFLKDIKFQHEQEIRIATMSLKTPGCVNMNGTRMKTDDYSGKNMNNFDNAGLYVGTRLNDLIDEIVLSPKTLKWFELLIKRIVELVPIQCEVVHSSLA
jgi:hypothetical protein